MVEQGRILSAFNVMVSQVVHAELWALGLQAECCESMTEDWAGNEQDKHAILQQ